MREGENESGSGWLLRSRLGGGGGAQRLLSCVFLDPIYLGGVMHCFVTRVHLNTVAIFEFLF